MPLAAVPTTWIPRSDGRVNKVAHMSISLDPRPLLRCPKCGRAERATLADGVQVLRNRRHHVRCPATHCGHVMWLEGFRSASMTNADGETGDEAHRERSALLSGYMNKKGEHFGASFKRRWFRVDGDKLVYSESPSSATKGSISMSSRPTVRVSQHPDAVCGEIEIVTPARTYRLRCDDNETAEKWIVGLSQLRDMREQPQQQQPSQQQQQQ